jgi:hypothetical protein
VEDGESPALRAVAEDGSNRCSVDHVDTSSLLQDELSDDWSPGVRVVSVLKNAPDPVEIGIDVEVGE